MIDPLAGWLLCVEYVQDLHREPHLSALTRLRRLSKPLADSVRSLVVELRKHRPEAYERLADEIEVALDPELRVMKPEDLGSIDTFRVEESRVLEGAVELLMKGDYSTAADWCRVREGDRSFWIQRDPGHRRAWDLVAEAATFGQILADHPRPFEGVRDFYEATTRYAERAALVDRTHRRLEQDWLRRLDMQTSHHTALQDVLGMLRQRYRDWADQLARDFTDLCRAQGFLPPEELQQRTLYDQVVQPLAHGGEKVAVFLVDALRYEMATELLDELRNSGGGVVVDLKARFHVGTFGTLIDLAGEAAGRAAGKKSLFFCQSRALTEGVAERMRGRGTDVFVHHSSVSLEERRAAEERFHGGKNACIVCTSTLELGIDVGDLDLVLQANAPTTVSSFLQRMGRTGRRPTTTANTTFLCEQPEAVLQAVALIELARAGWVEPVTEQRRCWPVFVHQLLALTLQFGAISAERCWDQLHRVPDFSGIDRSEFDAVVAHMLREDYLFESGGLLSMGEQAERVFGKKNFLELYAVFSSPVLFRVVTPTGREIGSLEQGFVDRLVEQMSSFLLGGRAWAVEHVSHKDRVVVVKDAPRGQKPSWGGFIPQMLGPELCQRIRQVHTEDDRYPYVSEQAHAVIDAARGDLGDLLRRPGPAVQLDDRAARWWTFAGGRVNHTLKYGLEILEGWRVVADNFQLRIEGDGVSHDTVRRAIDRLADPAWWRDPATERTILARLPEYRLSKFQRCLPERYGVEVVGAYLLDLGGAGGCIEGAGRWPGESGRVPWLH